MATAFRIAAIEPCSELVWLKPDSTWAWRLSEVDGGTRLVTRLRILYRWEQPLGALTSLVLNEFGDFPDDAQDAAHAEAARGGLGPSRRRAVALGAMH